MEPIPHGRIFDLAATSAAMLIPCGPISYLLCVNPGVLCQIASPASDWIVEDNETRQIKMLRAFVKDNAQKPMWAVQVLYESDNEEDPDPSFFDRDEYDYDPQIPDGPSTDRPSFVEYSLFDPSEWDVLGCTEVAMQRLEPYKVRRIEFIDASGRVCVL
jgi:hypothetical protein